jgi:hypothetical protein
MKRFAMIAAVLAVTACNSAAKEQARLDSIKADSTARAAAAAAEAQRVADSTKKADSIKAAASKSKTKTRPGATKR